MKSRKKNKRQSGMDSEIIYNYVIRQIPVYYLDNLYFHIEHSRKDLNRDNVRKLTVWENPKDWGMNKYKINQIKENIYLMSN